VFARFVVYMNRITKRVFLFLPLRSKPKYRRQPMVASYYGHPERSEGSECTRFLIVTTGSMSSQIPRYARNDSAPRSAGLSRISIMTSGIWYVGIGFSGGEPRYRRQLAGKAKSPKHQLRSNSCRIPCRCLEALRGSNV